MVWGKFQHKIKQYLHKRKYGIDVEQQPADPLLLLGQVMRELQMAITEHTKGLEASKQRQSEIHQYLQRLQQEQQHLLQLLARAQNTQKQAVAQEITQQITLSQEQIARYEQLNASMAGSIQEVEQAIAKLQFKLNETKAKESVLILKRSTANTQKELGRQLSRLDFTEQESEIARMEAEAEALMQLADSEGPQKELDALDQELAKQIQLQDLDKKLKEQQEKSAQRQTALIEKLFHFFNPPNVAQQKHYTDKQQLIDSFFQSEHTTEKPQSSDTPISIANNTAKEDIVSSFFEADAKKTADSKKQIIDDFFKD